MGFLKTFFNLKKGGGFALIDVLFILNYSGYG
ncbi:YjcZ family sporulation protein [Bacillus xiapuensis]